MNLETLKIQIEVNSTADPMTKCFIGLQNTLNSLGEPLDHVQRLRVLEWMHQWQVEEYNRNKKVK